MRTRQRPFLLFVVLALGACRGGPRAKEDLLEPPRISIAPWCYAGTPVRGLLPTGAVERLDGAPEHALALRIRAQWLERVPTGVGEPLQHVVRMIGARRGEDPIRIHSLLAADARVLNSDTIGAFEADLARGAHGRTREALSDTCALVVGATRGVELTGTRSGRPVAIAIDVHCPSRAAFEVALTFHGDARRGGDELDLDVDASPSAEIELVLIDSNWLREGARFGLVVPHPFDGGESAALYLQVEIERDPARVDATEHSTRVAETLAAALAAEHAGRVRAARVEERESVEHERRSALEALALAPNRRAALVFLSGATRAELCSDLALVADDAVLAELVQALTQSATKELDLMRDGAALAWHLEHGAWRFLVTKLGADAPVPLELRGVLVRHAGELARSAGALEDVLAASSDAADLERRLIDENRALLEDASPSARVRAYDWLVARAREPHEFDPLGPEQGRRRALDAADEAPR